MSTPSEEEARAATILASYEAAIEDEMQNDAIVNQQDAPLLAQALRELLASRALTPSSEYAQRIAAWLRDGASFVPEEWGQYQDQLDWVADFIERSAVSTPPSEDWEYAYSDSTSSDLPTSNVVDSVLAPIPGFTVLRRRKAGPWEHVAGVDSDV